MKIKNIYKVLATTMVLSQLMGPAISYAATQNSSEQTNQEQKEVKHGLLANYYTDDAFKDLTMFTVQSTSKTQINQETLQGALSKDKQQFQSVRWMGYIQPSESGEYEFSTSDDSHAAIQIDGKVILQNAPMKEKMTLEKGKTYAITVEYHTDKNGASQLEMLWSVNGKEKEVVPENNLVLPDFSKDKVKQFTTTAKSNVMADDGEITIDSDDDNIPDDWEINGYTVKNGLVVKWDDSLKEQGYTKYKSDPMNKHTTGDPFTDIDKVLGHVDGGILPEAKNPIVAAFPKIGVNMEKMILTKNQNVSHEQGQTETNETSHTVGISTTNSNTESNTEGVSASAGYPWSVSVSASYSHDYTTSVSVDQSNSTTTGHSNGKSWSETLGINTAEAAFLNGNVRYVNIGTAPIYNVKPTLNFVVGKGSSAPTISTVVAKANTVANVLNPGTSYPSTTQSPIAWNTMDDFNAQPIKLSYNQVQQIEKGDPLQIQTTQTSGNYKTYNADGDTIVNDSQKWENVMNDINSKTASITISTSNTDTKERYISARKAANYDQQSQPEITLGEAVETAFPGAKVDGDKLFYQNVDPYDMRIVLDRQTYDDIHNQMSQTGDQNIYHAKLKQGMNILIQPHSEKLLVFDPYNGNMGSLQFNKNGGGTLRVTASSGYRMAPETKKWRVIVDGKRAYTFYGNEFDVDVAAGINELNIPISGNQISVEMAEGWE
ncbi:binary toxin-like calcium binding domain-containing protein [Bacillus sp. FSL K6-0268]|uniref:binary toxin-like calcium binding domain-containing protein n=1 Tax=Bacillus sp. FSL K6-0268 TaxID=2921449 RepID=UPI0030FB8E57